MNKKSPKSTTRRGFVKKVAAGSAVAAATLAAGRSSHAASAQESVESKLQDLERRLRQLEDIQVSNRMQAPQAASKLDSIEGRLQRVEDIQAINRLQYAYNYYVEHMMKQEVIDCFSDSPDVLLDWLEGKWKGKAGVRKYFDVNQIPPVGFRHQLIPSAGLVTLAPDGRTAKGRWYAFGGIMMPIPAKEGEKPSFTRSFIDGIYEIGYIKENGIWKMLTIKWIIPYGVRIQDGWIMPEDIAGPMLKGQGPAGAPKMAPDIPMDKNDLRYVTGYIFPFHFVHPVTGRPSSEATLNSRLKPIKA